MRGSALFAGVAGFLPAFLACIQFAQAVELAGDFIQGGLVIARTEPQSAVILDGKTMPVAADGRFLIGFDRDHKSPATLEILYLDGRQEKRSFTIKKRHYEIQRIEGLPEKYVTPSPSYLARIRKEAAQKSRARKIWTENPYYLQGFIWPARGAVSGVYGSQRFYNGQARRPHYGVDIASPPGQRVLAPAPGVIRLAESDMYFEGGLVFIDHGHGLVSALMHLSSVDVEVGQEVAQGQVIGKTGATGRATGPHLDWRMYCAEVHIDPRLLVKGDPDP